MKYKVGDVVNTEEIPSRGKLFVRGTITEIDEDDQVFTHRIDYVECVLWVNINEIKGLAESDHKLGHSEDIVCENFSHAPETNPKIYFHNSETPGDCVDVDDCPFPTLRKYLS